MWLDLGVPNIRLTEWLGGCLWQISTIFSLPSKWHVAECFWLSGGLYRLWNLINKASEICLLFICPALRGFARAGKLPFSVTIFPRPCGAFLLFLTESDEHSQGTHCYPLGSLQQKKSKKKKRGKMWQQAVTASHMRINVRWGQTFTLMLY